MEDICRALSWAAFAWTTWCCVRVAKHVLWAAHKSARLFIVVNRPNCAHQVHINHSFCRNLHALSSREVLL